METENLDPYILLIEDNSAIRDALVWVLEYERYKTITAQDGLMALKLLEHEPLPSLIFLDLMMPVLDGIKFRDQKKLSPKLRNIPTIITSGEPNLKDLKIMPHEALLPKPFDLDNFLNIIKKYCPITFNKVMD